MKNFLMIICLVVMMLAMVHGTVAAAVIYVDAGAIGANDGTSWENAYNYLRDALTNPRGDQIWVAQGIYHPNDSKDPSQILPRMPSFWLCNGVAIYGGFPSGGGTWEDRNRKAYQTILTGDLYGDDGPDFANNDENNYHVVRGDGVDETAVLDGFTITGGNANNPKDPPQYMGGGVYLFNSTPTITNCTINSNFAIRGGGLYNEGNRPTVTNCTFISNTAEMGGGGMYNQGGSPTVTNCTFSDNTVSYPTGDGGGMSAGDATVINCAFSRNTAGGPGGGMSGKDATVINCTFSGNSAYSGGGMFYSYSYPTIINCTLSGNVADNSGGGIYNLGVSQNPCEPIIINCVIWGNSAANGDEIWNDASSKPTISFSNIDGCGSSESWNPLFGTDGGDNIDLDPLFVGAPDDLHLSPGSPCIDAGDNTAVPADITTDLDGNLRIMNNIVDMGAYEAQAPTDLLTQLAQDVISLNIEHGVINGLDAKLGAALGALDDLNENNDTAAINALEAFIHVVEQQSGDVIPVDDANALIAAALEIIDLLL